MSTSTKPAAPPKATSAIPKSSKNNVLLIPYTAKTEKWQPGERRREVERNIVHPYFRLGHLDDRSAEKLLASLATLQKAFGSFVDDEWGREKDLRAGAKQFLEDEWTREGELRREARAFVAGEATPFVAWEELPALRGADRRDVSVAEAVAQVALAATLVPPLVALAPFLVPFSVAYRKQIWARAVRASMAEHGAAFEAARDAYRADQQEVVDRLGAAEASRTAPTRLDKVVVTMATSQEGAAVVRALLETERCAVGSVVALVRDPSSAKARAIKALDPERVELVTYDARDAASIANGLKGADAAYLCTTLNRASAGDWAMDWDGGAYEMEQGKAFAEACGRVPGLRQVIYGTAPMRKWPEAFVVEPPIHYAAKWEIEKMLVAAGVPLTCLRKCPYHENFTKLTKSGADASGKWRPGDYKIKALTPPDFVYNMLDPKDAGPWAALCFAHPDVLVGESLSIASDCKSGAEMAADASESLGEGVRFSYSAQPRFVFECLAFFEPTFVYISGLQRWNSDGGAYDLDRAGVERLRALHSGTTWKDHLKKEGLLQFTDTMADLLPTAIK